MAADMPKMTAEVSKNIPDGTHTGELVRYSYGRTSSSRMTSPASSSRPAMRRTV
jgi:hypothetical protein